MRKTSISRIFCTFFADFREHSETECSNVFTGCGADGAKDPFWSAHFLLRRLHMAICESISYSVYIYILTCLVYNYKNYIYK